MKALHGTVLESYSLLYETISRCISNYATFVRKVLRSQNPLDSYAVSYKLSSQLSRITTPVSERAEICRNYNSVLHGESCTHFSIETRSMYLALVLCCLYSVKLKIPLRKSFWLMTVLFKKAQYQLTSRAMIVTSSTNSTNS